MINFDGADFSECRPEEVIRLFWRSSVYINLDEDLNDFAPSVIQLR